MFTPHFTWFIVGALFPLYVAAAQSSGAAAKKKGTEISTLLSGRIWKLTHAPSQPAHGSIHVFLANGTLLQTSCVETYRIAKWMIDPKQSGVLRVIEDGRLAYTAKITELTSVTLRLQRTLVRSKEQDSISFRAIEKEFLCPDLRK